MAHGSKKWIVDCMGNRRKSSNTTAVDFWRPIRKVDADLKYNTRHYSFRGRKKGFCPQCRQVAKTAYAIVQQYRSKRVDWHAEYNKLFGEWHQQHDAYWRAPLRIDKRGFQYRDAPFPNGPRPPEYWEWAKDKPKPRAEWNFDARSFMCAKHQRIDEMQDKMYRLPYPGNKDYRQSYRREEIARYRAQVKHAMRTEQFDDIPVFNDRKLWR